MNAWRDRARELVDPLAAATATVFWIGVGWFLRGWWGRRSR